MVSLVRFFASTTRIKDISDSVRFVEQLLDYRFNKKSLLEEALTHSSYTLSASYERLEFVGDAVLGLAIADFLFLDYPDLGPGGLSSLRSSNVSNENLARVAIRHGLHRNFRHNNTAIDEKVKEFALAVQQEDNTVVNGGKVKAPKVLADIVESVAGAVYVDCESDPKVHRKVFRSLMEPLVPEILPKPPQPVTSLLTKMGQKNGRHVEIKHSREGKKKDIASVEGTTEIEGGKKKLQELCAKKGWLKPGYRIEKDSGPHCVMRYICSVEIKTSTDNVLFKKGVEKSRIKDAENSAASLMIRGLHKDQR